MAHNSRLQAPLETLVARRIVVGWKLALTSAMCAVNPYCTRAQAAAIIQFCKFVADCSLLKQRVVRAGRPISEKWAYQDFGQGVNSLFIWTLVGAWNRKGDKSHGEGERV